MLAFQRYTFNIHDAERSAEMLTPAPALPLRPRNAELDAMVGWMHGSEAFQVRNAVQTVRDAMARAAAKKRAV